MLYDTGVTYKGNGMAGLRGGIHSVNSALKGAQLPDYVHLLTCNRSEVFSTRRFQPDGLAVNGGQSALAHLFRISCGLDSMIIGETEILGQLKNAYENAIGGDHCSEVLASYFKAAIGLGKRARARTGISKGRLSISSLAIEKALEIEPNPGEVLIIGSGAMAGKLATALANKGIREIFLANRHYDRAKLLAEKIGGRAAPLSNLPQLIKRARMVFSATNAPKQLIKTEFIPKDKELLIIDLSVPYDAPEELEGMDNLTLIRLESFQDVADANLAKKQEEIKKVERLIQDELKRFQFP